MERDYYVDSLRKSNFKITPQRLTVIDYVRDHSPGHFTAEKIFNAIREEEPTITLATVYNILKALQSAGTLKSLELNGTTWFETNTKFHANFLCTVCGNIYDMDMDEDSLLRSIDVDGNLIEQASLILKGVCRECRRNGYDH